ncbi:unnamed protein product [Diatraea saccharalis]|uniref:tRNA-binding domain-containing protein n=1 Tax=Diatraea saccharalis TaxID=40085 RepID=A0A9N9WB57_9NEOP|nr:unnamed protein product [Diatraea saccharalis]
MLITRKMSQNIAMKLLNNAEVAEKKLSELKTKLEELKSLKIKEKIKQLTNENDVLVTKVEKAKDQLIKLETLNGKKQYSLPNKTVAPKEAQVTMKTEVLENNVNKKEKKESSKKGKGKDKASESSDVVDIRKLDLRIGKIVNINKHPDADTLYVEQIDCGEEKPRTVVSGLVNHVPIEEMINRIVMILCNLKPVKMRGVVSEAMVMCASSPDKVEVLIPPNNAVPGDLVTCEGYPREPEVQLNPKKKIFETCAPDLKTNGDRIACYKGNPLVVPGKGPVVSASLSNVFVK